MILLRRRPLGFGLYFAFSFRLRDGFFFFAMVRLFDGFSFSAGTPKVASSVVPDFCFLGQNQFMTLSSCLHPVRAITSSKCFA